MGPALSEVTGIPLRKDAQVIQGCLVDGQQPVEPEVHTRLTQAEEFGHDSLQRIGLEVNQQKQQLLLRAMQCSFAPSANEPPARFPGYGLVQGIPTFIGLCERGQQALELPKRQSGECRELSAIILESWISYHEAIFITDIV